MLVQIQNDKSWLTGKISAEVLENCGIDLEPLYLAEQREMGTMYYMAQSFFKDTLQDIGSTQVNENQAWKMSQAVSHFRNITLETLNKTSNLLSRGLCTRICNSNFEQFQGKETFIILKF